MPIGSYSILFRIYEADVTEKEVASGAVLIGSTMLDEGLQFEVIITQVNLC